MSPLYIQHLLTVLLEEYEDIGYMLDSLEHRATPEEHARIRDLLGKLDHENHALIKRIPGQLPALRGTRRVPQTT